MPKRKTTKEIRMIERLLTKYNFMKAIIIEDEKLLNSCYDLSGVSYDKSPSAPTNEFHSDTENKLLMKIDLETRIESNRMYIARLESAMRLLRDREREVIESFYIDDDSWISISHHMNTSVKQLMRIRDVAIDKMVISMFGGIVVTRELLG